VADHLRQLLPLLDWLALQGLAVENWYAPAAEAGCRNTRPARPPSPDMRPQPPPSRSCMMRTRCGTMTVCARWPCGAVKKTAPVPSCCIPWARSATASHATCCCSQFLLQLEQRDTLLALVSALVQWWPASRVEIGISSPQEEDAGHDENALLDDPLGDLDALSSTGDRCV
jgi:hypothetical protein